MERTTDFCGEETAPYCQRERVTVKKSYCTPKGMSMKKDNGITQV
jgi:hypothetical protein